MFTDNTPDTAPSPQDRRLEHTRQAILDTARRMIVAHGPTGLSIRALAEGIDYTPGALYRYFSSKEELVDTVRSLCFEELNELISERIQSAATPSEMLLEGGMAYIEYAGEHPQEYHLMFNMEPSRATSGAQRKAAMRALLEIIRAGVEQGQITPQEEYNVEAITFHCWATVHGIASLHAAVLHGEHENQIEISRTILEKVIRGFTTRQKLP